MLHKIEALQSHIKKLNRNYGNALVVVEGKKDARALKPILEADLFILNNGKKRSLYETAEVLASSPHERVLLILDADLKGKELRRRMKSYLQQLGAKVSEEDKLLKLARVRAVEDLASAEIVGRIL